MKIISFSEALKKAEHFCSYRDRCIFEANNKLYQWNIEKEDCSKIISNLCENNYINEERFACLFSRGKFNNNKWGKQKIYAALQAKQIDTIVIKKSLREIDENKYYSILSNIIEKKIIELKKSNPKEDNNIIIKKAISYALQKGYEFDIIKSITSSIISNNNNE